jgi:hypothetical protein
MRQLAVMLALASASLAASFPPCTSRWEGTISGAPVTCCAVPGGAEIPIDSQLMACEGGSFRTVSFDLEVRQGIALPGIPIGRIVTASGEVCRGAPRTDSHGQVSLGRRCCSLFISNISGEFHDVPDRSPLVQGTVTAFQGAPSCPGVARVFPLLPPAIDLHRVP